MRLLTLTTLIVFTLLATSCKGHIQDSVTEEQAQEEKKNLYDDGTYCSEITYHNPNTGRTSEYTLNVEVEDGKLVKIFWSNGGWLDDSHFTPPVVSSTGTCSFTSDRGYDYDVRITGSECSSTDNPTAFEGREPGMTRRQCAQLYGASDELFNDLLQSSNLSAEDVITEKQCDLMHQSLATLEKLRNLQHKMDQGYIQSVLRVGPDDGSGCQNMIVKRYNVYYLLEVTGGKATMGLTSFDPNNTDWQRIVIQEDPSVDQWTVVIARIVGAGTKFEMDELSRNFCR